MFENRISGFDMGLGDQLEGPTNRPLPIHMGLLRGMQAPVARPQQVSISDIYQAATNRAIQDHELDKLFNPDFYDYQI
jgi:hypothetical protein